MDAQYSNGEIREYLLRDPRNLKVRIIDGGYKVEVLRVTQVGIHQKNRWHHIGNRRIVQQMIANSQTEPDPREVCAE